MQDDQNSREKNTENESRELAVYFHLPFCIKKCLYCDFVSGPYPKEVQESYVNKILWEIEEFFEKKVRISSVFFGGGTPSILPPEEIEKILCKLKEHSEFVQPEITIEVNPGTVKKGIFEKYKAMGINRISIGLQSTSDEELKTLGRIHTYEDFLNTFNQAKEAGFENISADVIYAIPGQNYQSFEKTIRTVAELGLTHISAYSLIVEEGTPFYEMDLDLPSEEEERRMYEGAASILSEYGFKQYEISNYAMPGYECRHNVAYWTGKEYAGFGVAAASLIKNTQDFDAKSVEEDPQSIDTKAEISKMRYTNTKSLDAYLDASDYEQLKALRTDVEMLSVEDCMSETVILGLRMNAGVRDADFYGLYGAHLRDIFPKAIEKHKWERLLSENENGDIALTRRGRNLSNYVMADFLL